MGFEIRICSEGGKVFVSFNHLGEYGGDEIGGQSQVDTDSRPQADIRAEQHHGWRMG